MKVIEIDTDVNFVITPRGVGKIRKLGNPLAFVERLRHLHGVLGVGVSVDGVSVKIKAEPQAVIETIKEVQILINKEMV